MRSPAMVSALATLLAALSAEASHAAAVHAKGNEAEQAAVQSVAVWAAANPPVLLAAPIQIPPEAAAFPLAFTAESTLVAVGGKVRRANVLRRAKGVLHGCQSLAADSNGELRMTPSKIHCVDGAAVLDGGNVVVEVEDASGALLGSAILAIPDRDLPLPGTDYGFSLNLIDRKGDDEEFDRVDSAMTYYALSRLKNEHVRPVLSLAILDFEPTEDFEIGVGLGLLFQPRSFETEKGIGLGLVGGYGVNLMVGGESREYWFLGIGLNKDRDKD